MTNLRLVIRTAVSGALLGGFVGAIIGAVAGRGTSVLLPGLGLIVSGSLALGIAFGLIGMFLGFLLGLCAAAIKISSRRGDYP